jgi:FixJ family two-component response regulator
LSTIYLLPTLNCGYLKNGGYFMRPVEHPVARPDGLNLPTIVHIVDDDASFRTATGRLLRQAGYDVALYVSAHQMLDQLPDESRPGCVLLDVRIPGLTGPELQAQLAERGFSLPIIFLTGYGDIPTSVQAIKAGADDFLTKPVPKEKLFAAIERAVAGYQAARAQRDYDGAMLALVETLTEREREVFELVIQGKLNKQIGHDLEITERTVKAHRHNVMEKMRVQSLAELVSLAVQLGIGPRR